MTLYQQGCHFTLTMPRLAIAAAALLLLRRRRQRRRRVWVREFWKARSQRGLHQLLFAELFNRDFDFFRCYLRMSPGTFEALLHIVRGPLTKLDTNLRVALSAEERLALTLRFIGHGDSQRLLAIMYRIGVSTVCTVIGQTLRVLSRCLGPIAMPTCTVERLRETEKGFRERWNFPNCIGSVDGKHIRIQCPPCSGSQFYNYKGFYSIVLMAVADHECNFLMIDVGNCGSQSDSGSFRHSKFGARLKSGELQRPDPQPLEPNGVPVPHVLVADEAFPLKDYIMRPYPGRRLSDEQAVFNYRLSRARRVVENSFGILTHKWRIFQRPIQMSSDNATRLVKVVCLLHNFVRMHESQAANSDHADEPVILQLLSTVRSLDGTRGGVPRSAKDVQAHFAEFFLSDVGSVPWQMRSIHRE